MRILLATGIYPPDAGGPATYTRALARALSSSGQHQVEVVCYGEKDEILDADGYPVERIGRNRSLIARYWNFFHAVRRRASACDVVYLQGPVSEGFPGTLAAIVSGKPTVMKVVGDYAWEIYAGSGGSELLDEFLTHRHSGKIWMLEMIERWTAKRAVKLIVPSEYLETVVKKWGVAQPCVIHNQITLVESRRSREETLQSVGIPSDARVLLSAARAVPWKATDFILNLIQKLPSDIYFVHAGSGPELENWKKEVIRLNISDRVRFLGWVDQYHLADWYNASGLFVLPSGYEGFPHVIAEADARGLPSIVSDQGGNALMQKMFPETVRVLPYRDNESWTAALSTQWPSRIQRAARTSEPHLMISETIKVLESIKR